MNVSISMPLQQQMMMIPTQRHPDGLFSFVVRSLGRQFSPSIQTSILQPRSSTHPLRPTHRFVRSPALVFGRANGLSVVPAEQQLLMADGGGAKEESMDDDDDDDDNDDDDDDDDDDPLAPIRKKLRLREPDSGAGVAEQSAQGNDSAQAAEGEMRSTYVVQ